jgi:hypothetical protein
MSIDPQIDLGYASFTDDDITKLVHEELPHWKDACEAQGADNVILTQRAFGHSAKKMFLLAAAIKYAGRAQKAVTLIPPE